MSTRLTTKIKAVLIMFQIIQNKRNSQIKAVIEKYSVSLKISE